MKRFGIILYCFVTALLFNGIINLNAQVQVSKGSIHHYSVSPLPDTASYDYHWMVTPGGTSSYFGTDDTTNDILWDGAAGLYTITVYPTGIVSGCAGGNQTLLISIVEMNIVWSSTGSTQCPKTDNQSGNFSITADYTGITGAWSFTYRIDDAAEQLVTVAAGNIATIDINGFTNTSGTTPVIHTIRISSITTPDNYTFNYSGMESDAFTRLYNVTVDPTPNTSGIIQLE